MQDVLSGVYKITCTATNKVYIGESSDIFRRWKEHESMLLENKHHSWKLQNAYNEYGANNFICKVLELIQDKEKSNYILTMERIYREGYYIDQFDSINNGYNMEHTLNEILNGNKYRLSKKTDQQYLINLVKTGILTKAERKALSDYNARKKMQIRNGTYVQIIDRATGKELCFDIVSGIFYVTNINTGCKYVGFAKDVHKSIHQIVNNLQKRTHANKKLQEDWITLGRNCFKFELAERVTSINRSHTDYLKCKHIFPEGYCEDANVYTPIPETEYIRLSNFEVPNT